MDDDEKKMVRYAEALLETHTRELKKLEGQRIQCYTTRDSLRLSRVIARHLEASRKVLRMISSLKKRQD